jgi:hypothetical protein
MHCFGVKLAVHTVTVAFWKANYCAKCAEGGPATGSGLSSSNSIEPRRWFSKQLLNCLTIRTVLLKCYNLPIPRVQQHGRYRCFAVAVGLT